MKIFCRNASVVISIFLIFLLTGCNVATSNPWLGFATNKETGKIEWWLSSYPSHRECIRNMYWQVKNDEFQKENYKEPFGCGYLSNNIIDAVLRNELVGDMQFFECLADSKNPEAEKMLVRYSPVLNQINEKQCVSNSNFDIVWIGRFGKK